MLKRLFVAMLPLCMAGALAAQNTYSLRGQFADGKGDPLPFTNAVILNATDSTFVCGTTSDMEGVFAFDKVAGGSYFLRATSIGYEPLWLSFALAGDTNLGTLLLNSAATMLSEVKITASRPLYSADGEKVFYNVGDDPSVQSGNATDALQNAPGVEVDAEGNIKYRGGAEVAIWINDKPSHLKAEGLKQYLKSLPAGTLQRIEVIAHPSAKYHTKNCVINIVTTAKVKRNELLCLGLNADSKPQLGPWVDYVWANEKVRFNLFVSGNFDNDSTTAGNNSRAYAPDGRLSSASASRGHSRSRSLGGNFGIDFDYNIDTNTLVNFWLWGTAAHDSTGTLSRTERTEYIHNAGRYFYNETSATANGMADVAFGTILEKKLDTLGGMLYIDYTGTLTRSRALAETFRLHDSLAALDFRRRNSSLGTMQWHGITADVALPYSRSGEVDFGLMASLSPESKDVEETNGGAVDALRSYSLVNSSYDLSLYAGAEHHFGRLTLGASLSMDNGWYSLRYPGADSGDVSKHFLTLSPTVHASYSTESMHNFTFSYTHYAVPPAATQLTRFTVYGYDSYSTGNPSLRNGYSDHLELGWERYFDHLGSIGLSTWYAANTDQTGTLTDVAWCDQFGRIVAFSEPFNVGTSRNGGITLNTTLRPLDFMNIRFYASLFDDYYRVQYRPGQWQESGMLCYSLRLNFWTKLWDKLQLFTNAVYRSRTQTLLAEVDPYFSLDCGISTDLFDRSLSIFLNVNDLFNTVRTGGESVNPYNPSTSESVHTTRYISFGLTWRLGRTEMEGQQRRASSKGSRGVSRGPRGG